MNTAGLIRLFALAAIWGASFLLLRIAAPVLGPAVLIEGRLLSAALFLFAVALALGKCLKVGQHWRHYLILGLLNSALPFLLLAFAAQTLSASLLSILNATSPIWSANPATAEITAGAPGARRPCWRGRRRRRQPRGKGRGSRIDSCLSGNADSIMRALVFSASWSPNFPAPPAAHR